MNVLAQTIISHAEARRILGVSEKFLRLKRNGRWLHYPQLTRIQHVAPKGRKRGSELLFLKEQVEALLIQITTPQDVTPARTVSGAHLTERERRAAGSSEKTLKILLSL